MNLSFPGTFKHLPSPLLCLTLLISFNADAALKGGLAEGQLSFQQIDIDNLNGDDAKLKGYLLPANTEGKAPAAVFSPACGGLTFPYGPKVRPFYRHMARKLNEIGITVLMIDGFKPRGVKEVCSQKGNEREIDTAVRMLDSFSGLKYLRSREDIDADKIFMFTWGAAGSFEAMVPSDYLERVGKGFAAGVFFYPKCDSLNAPFAPYAPIQMFVGELDAWNEPQYCESLKERQEKGSAEFNIKIYPDSYHGFDHPGRPHTRKDAVVGEVMTGGNPQAKQDAYKVTTEFLSRFLN